MGVALERSVEDEIATLVAGHADERGSLLPLLHAIQTAIGHIPAEAIKLIADGLNLSRAEVHGVVSFYHDFRTRPPGKHVIKLCRAESCQARGGAAVEAAASARLGVAMGETRADGQVTLEPVYCIGLCAIGPNALVDGRPVCRIDLGMLDLIAERISA